MIDQAITCPMCGFTYLPGEHLACHECPVQKGCRSLTCCPACGFETIDVNQSRLARMAAILLAKIDTHKQMNRQA